MYPIHMEMFPTPMITDEISRKRCNDDAQDEPIKTFRLSPVPMDVDDLHPMDIDIVIRPPFVFLPIPQLIRCDHHIN